MELRLFEMTVNRVLKINVLYSLGDPRKRNHELVYPHRTGPGASC